MSGSPRARVRVVLVRPEQPANVGAVARVIRNNGLDGLDLVAPGDWRTVECWRTAWGAHDVLEQARVFATLTQALSDATWAAGLSRQPAAEAVRLDVRELGSEVAARPQGDRVALVFGPERSGLTRDEVVACGRRVRIPTHPDQPSLNLSHAVAVTAYEVFRASGRAPAPARLADYDDKQAALALLRESLQAAGALPAVNTEHYFKRWRAIVLRADLTPDDVRLLEHLARRLTRLARVGGGEPVRH